MKSECRVKRCRTFKKWSAVLGLVAASIFGSCTPKTEPPLRSIRCYNYAEKRLRVYSEEKAQGNVPSELGKEHSLQFQKLEIGDEKNNADPLAYYCTNDGHLFWITSDKVFVRRISVENNDLQVKRIFESQHSEPSEYDPANIKVISADIWRNPSEKWENITFATLTNSGILQISRLTQTAIAKKEPDRKIYDLSGYNELKNELRWPKKGVAGGIVNIIDREEFAVFPVGERGVGTVKYYYVISVKGTPGESLRKRKIHTEVFAPCDDKEGLKNVFEIRKPFRLDRNSGGFIIDLTGEKENGEVLQLLPVIKPIQK